LRRQPIAGAEYSPAPLLTDGPELTPVDRALRVPGRMSTDSSLASATEIESGCRNRWAILSAILFEMVLGERLVL